LCLFFSNELDLPVSSNTLFLPSSGWFLTFTSDGPQGLDQELAKADTQGGGLGHQDFPPATMLPVQTSHWIAQSLHRSINFHLPFKIRSLLAFLQASQTQISWSVLPVTWYLYFFIVTPTLFAGYFALYCPKVTPRALNVYRLPPARINIKKNGATR